MTTLRSEFRNDSGGLIGVVLIDERGQRQGSVVRPGESVWLTEPEEVATANAPRSDADNPFTNGALTLLTRAQEVANRRPIGSREIVVNEQPPAPEAPPAPEPPRVERPPTAEPIPAEEHPPLPPGDPEHGVRPPAEEVGTPQAVAQAGTQQRRGTTRGQTVKTAPPGAKPPASEPGRPKAVVVGANGPAYADVEGQ